VPYNSVIERADVAGLIPDEYALGVIQDMPRTSAALGTFRRATIPRGVTHIPVLSVLPQAYWVGETDTGLKQTSEQDWENVTLTARELAVIIPIPQAVLDDASIDLWAEVRPRLAEAFGAKIDAAALFGTSAPTAWPDSIVEQAVTAGNEYTIGDSGGDLSVDISEVWALVEDDGFDVDVQWARRRIKSRLRGLRTDDGQVVFQNALTTGGPPAIYGEELVIVANGAWDNSIAMVVGDRSKAILGVRQDIDYRIFTEGVISDDSGNVVLNLMQQDAVAMRATMRVGYAVANPINVENTDDNTRFPFAVLNEAGS
jgi:HK97 family phage major capsid protein